MRDWQGSPRRRAQLLAAGFAYDITNDTITDEWEQYHAKPYLRAGQRFHHDEAILVMKLNHMFYELPAYEPQLK